MSESCKQPESSGIGTRGMLQDTHSFCFLNNAGHSHVFRHLEHTHTDTRAPTTLPNSLTPLLFFPPPLSVCTTSAAAGECSIAFQSRAERRAGQAEWPCVGHPAERGNLPTNVESLSFSLSFLSLSLCLSLCLSLSLSLCLSLSLFLSLFSRAASRETAKLLLSCHSGTDDKAGLFTRRRDPGYGTHTYGRQEWKEGILIFSLPSNSPPLPTAAAASAAAAAAHR